MKKTYPISWVLGELVKRHEAVDLELSRTLKTYRDDPTLEEVDRLQAELDRLDIKIAELFPLVDDPGMSRPHESRLAS